MVPSKIILLLLDGCRVDMLGAHPIFRHLEDISTFSRHLLTYAPYTTASMHALLSGIYGSRNGTNSYYTASHFKKESCRTLPEIFAAAKYHCVVDINDKSTIPCHGYHEVREYDEFAPENRYNLIDRHRELVLSVLKKKRKFLVSLHNLKLHTELIECFRYEFSDEKERLYYLDPERNRDRIRKNVTDLGGYVESFLNFLEERRFFDDGLLVVYSDHGCATGELAGERMYGTYLNDFTVNTFIYFAGRSFIDQGRMLCSFGRTVDIFPTLLSVCGITPDFCGFLEPDGCSLLPGSGESPQYAFVQTAPLGGPTPSPYVPNYHGMISRHNKLLYNSQTDSLEFFIRKDGTWVESFPNGPEFENHLSELCAISPIVNRKFLLKYS